MVKDCYEQPDQTPDVVTKVCNRCHRSLPVTSFNRKSSTKDGYQFQCKECQAELARQLYERRKVEQMDAPKPETKFGYAPKNQNGLKSYCRDCENENCRKYRAKKKAARPKKEKDKPDYSGLTDFERAVHRGFLCAGVDKVSKTIIQETAKDCLSQLPEMTLDQAIDILVSKGFTITISKPQNNE